MALRIRSAAKILTADAVVHGVQWVVLCIEQRALHFLSIVEGNARLVVRTPLGLPSSYLSICVSFVELAIPTLSLVSLTFAVST